LRRLRRMAKVVRMDVRWAMRTEVALEAANDLIVADPNKKLPGAATYEAISLSLTMHLALLLGRIFDKGSRLRPPNKKDIASIPLLMRLLRQARCRRAIRASATRWPGPRSVNERACNRSIDRASAAYAKLRGGPWLSAIRRLRSLRNRALAHSMRDLQPARPLYKDLFLLADLAAEISEAASHAIHGIGETMHDEEEVYRKDADRFWKYAFHVAAAK